MALSVLELFMKRSRGESPSPVSNLFQSCSRLEAALEMFVSQRWLRMPIWSYRVDPSGIWPDVEVDSSSAVDAGQSPLTPTTLSNDDDALMESGSSAVAFSSSFSSIGSRLADDRLLFGGLLRTFDDGVCGLDELDGLGWGQTFPDPLRSRTSVAPNVTASDFCGFSLTAAAGAGVTATSSVEAVDAAAEALR